MEEGRQNIAFNFVSRHVLNLNTWCESQRETAEIKGRGETEEGAGTVRDYMYACNVHL